MSKDVATAVKKEFRILNWLISVVFILLFVLQGAAFYYVVGMFMQQPTNTWLPGLGISSLIFIIVAIATYSLLSSFGNRVRKTAAGMFHKELHQLRAANDWAQSLRKMASVLRVTRSFERVVEEALGVCSLTLEEMGIPRNALAGAVFLFSGQHLIPVATRRFLGKDAEKYIPGKNGVIGDALAEAEVTVTDTPQTDPELKRFAAFQNAVTAVCIPLRTGFQIFGAMVITSNTAVKFNEDHFELFNSVADQAVIALQNAQLYQRLEAEKRRLIEADEEARKELARDLHDGPTQTIAAIAMRANFIRSLLNKDPDQAVTELQKVEELAKQTSKEIRGLLFKLRPLVLETQGLAAAIETVMKRIKETDGLNMRLVGGEHSDLLTDNAQSVVFSIVEEALGNARKYSKANLIEVRFWKEDNLFVARVKDDGEGFDVAGVNRNYSSRGSLGMVNMRERAERIDGSLRVESEVGKGATITLVVPLNKHGHRQRTSA